MSTNPQAFFQAIISAGSILCGFCGTFLAFRIQREANYYRQPVLSYEKQDAKDVFIGLTHFTSPFLLLTLSMLCSMSFGFAIPLLALAGWAWALLQTRLVTVGLLAALILLIGYFFDELVHYRILSQRLLHDRHEWHGEWGIVIASVILILACWLGVYSLP